MYAAADEVSTKLKPHAINYKETEHLADVSIKASRVLRNQQRLIFVNLILV
jgi:hypothetical protein